MEDGEEALKGEGLGAEEVAGDLTATGGRGAVGGKGLALLAPPAARDMLGCFAVQNGVGARMGVRG